LTANQNPSDFEKLKVADDKTVERS